MFLLRNARIPSQNFANMYFSFWSFKGCSGLAHMQSNLFL